MSKRSFSTVNVGLLGELFSRRRTVAAVFSYTPAFRLNRAIQDLGPPGRGGGAAAWTAARAGSPPRRRFFVHPASLSR
jgi:hypothetical protein